MSNPPPSAPASLPATPRWQRWLWLTGGILSLLLGIVGILVPLLPTTPFILLAAACFSRGSARCERWLLAHPRFGPLIRDWRAYRAMPLRAKQLAWVMMAVGSLVAWLILPRLAWLPGLCCALVAVWIWRLPTRQSDGSLSQASVVSSNSGSVSPPGL